MKLPDLIRGFSRFEEYRGSPFECYIWRKIIPDTNIEYDDKALKMKKLFFLLCLLSRTLISSSSGTIAPKKESNLIGGNNLNTYGRYALENIKNYSEALPKMWTI